MRLPASRGPLGERLHEVLSGTVDRAPRVAPLAVPGETPEDRAQCLWVLHELHYRGFEDVDERWEWSPALMPLRQRLESDLEGRLRRRFESAGIEATPGRVVDDLLAMIDKHEGPSLARHVQKQATWEETADLLRQRSLYHLKEADPTSWVLARLDAGPKAPLAQVQLDEYGSGDSDRLHHALFARGLAASGLDAGYGAYVGEAVLPVLEQNNALSMFGLHRRLRGAALGHLAAFESTSSLPSRRIAQGLRRLGFPESMAAYYDEHVEADAVHEQLVVRDVCARLVACEPGQHDAVLLGAWSCLDLEARTATTLLERWAA